jgi:hypothetical protein
VFLEGSSGSGKSQMGFTIKAKIQNHRQVHYFLFDSIGPASQSIYLNFWNISKLFKMCCLADVRVYSFEAGSPNCSSLFRESLYVYGFFYALLNETNSPVVITPKTGNDVRMLMIEKNIHHCRPIFILDECIAISDESLKKVRFVRNCFRSLGLGLVMLGTDSRAAKLPSDIGESSRSELPRPWCYIIGKFPAVNLSLLEMPADVSNWLQYILMNSRPLFAQLVASKMFHGFKDFDTLMKDVFLHLVTVKKIYGNYHGKLGQLRLFQNAHYSLENWGNFSTPLIHSHFAQLYGPQKNFLLMNDGCIFDTGSIWKPCSAFPKVQDDILLYLIFMGGRDHSAFQLSGQQVPYSHFLREVIRDIDWCSNILDLSNAAQKSNDGMFLESLLCSTVCVASHANGVKGISFNHFLVNLVYHLQIDKIDRSEITISNLEQMNAIDLIVPFLSPANQKWPDYLQIPGFNIGLLERTRNVDKIDLRSSCGLVGESKDYGSEINLQTMRQILKRVPEQAIVELVFTRKLQHSYFNDPAKSFEDEFQGSHLLNMAFFKIDTSNPRTLLEPIKGLPKAKLTTKRAVIFFQINGMLVL